MHKLIHHFPMNEAICGVKSHCHLSLLAWPCRLRSIILRMSFSILNIYLFSFISELNFCGLAMGLLNCNATRRPPKNGGGFLMKNGHQIELASGCAPPVLGYAIFSARVDNASEKHRCQKSATQFRGALRVHCLKRQFCKFKFCIIRFSPLVFFRVHCRNGRVHCLCIVSP